jgi:hypothetical protein
MTLLQMIPLFTVVLVSQKGFGDEPLNKNLLLNEFQKKVISIGCKSPKAANLKPLSMSNEEYIKWYSDFGITNKLSLIAKCKSKDGSFYKVLFEKEVFATEEEAKRRLPRIKELPPKENGKSDFAISTLLREGFRLGNQVYTIGTFAYGNELSGDLHEWRAAFEK